MVDAFRREIGTVGAIVIAFVMVVPAGFVVYGAGAPEIHVAPDLAAVPDSSLQTTVTGDQRSVSYVWYDMFNVPFGPWYPRRALYYGGAGYEMNWTDHYPYIYEYYGDNAHNNMYLYSNLRVNMTAMNLPKVKMSHPEFLPLFSASPTGSGTAVLNWHMQYMDPADVDRIYGSAATMYNDGWIINLTGVTNLDKNAAMDVTGMSAADWDNFPSWWVANGLALRDKWAQWLVEDQANGAFDINNMYTTPMQGIGWGLKAQKNFAGDKLTITIYLDSWGMEALMARWLRDAFVPTEMWMEGFWMNATIGPQSSNIFITTAVEYGVYAFMSRNESLAQNSKMIWLWKPLHGDYLESSPEHPKSEFDPYAKTINPDTGTPYTYMNWNPGSALYATQVPYDKTPCAWNLSKNESMSFTWPAGLQQFEMDTGVPNAVHNITSEMTVSYAEPMPGDTLVAMAPATTPGSVVINKTQRLLTYTGPIDFWDWSRNQSAANHQVLEQQWGDIDYKLLPESVPYVEFCMASGPPPQTVYLVVSGPELNPVAGYPATFTVTAYDQYIRVFRDYSGTMHFDSNRSADVVLPGDYSFTPSDAGVHVFTDGMLFGTGGWFRISAWDVANPGSLGSADVYVLPTAEEINHFTIDITRSVTATSPVDLTVTAWDQYGLVFRTYSGTVEFATNASSGTYLLPSSYTFLGTDEGVHQFSSGATWNEPGVYLLTVRDSMVTTADGSVSGILVSSGTKIDYRIYNMFEDHWMPFWIYRWPTYGTDVILSNDPGNYTMINYWGGQVSIWAPYRMNITAKALPNMNIRSPVLMPVMDRNTSFADSQATVEVYFQYLYWSWWNSTWVKKWSSDPNWYAGSMRAQTYDGWYLGVEYNVTMNRETAQQWMRLPLTLPESSIPAWWAANASSFKKNWKIWLMDEMNNVTDIYNGYEFPGTVTGPYATLEVLPTGDVRLDLAMVNWGYEIVMVKWLLKYGICPHQPFLENCTIVAQMRNKTSDFTLDAVCQYGLKAVGANQSAGHSGRAWAFEALSIDYIQSSPWHPDSRYDPYVDLFYESWNAGDMWFGMPDMQDFYETTPSWFNLTESQTLTFELPRHQVIGYEGRATTFSDIENITYGPYPYGRGSLFGDRSDYSGYDALVGYDDMSLGYYITNFVPGVGAANQPLDLSSMYDPYTKTLTITGPHCFDNSGRGEGNAMYHGAPWIEFNVTRDLWVNSPPSITPQTDKLGVAGTPVTFTATASDPDGDLIRYTWDFGDGSPLAVGQSAVHSYAHWGEYNFTVHADDMTGVPGHNVSSSAKISISFDVQLAPGWNMVTVPLNWTYAASTLGLSMGDMILKWNSVTQAYGMPYIVGVSAPSFDFAIEQGTSYLVWTSAAETLHIYGSVPVGPISRSIDVPSGGGWVLLGLLGVDATRHASDLSAAFSSVHGDRLTMVAAYVSGSFTTWVLHNSHTPDFLLTPGRAYWCWVTASGSVTYTP